MKALVVNALPRVRCRRRRVRGGNDLALKRIALREVNDGYAALADGSLNRLSSHRSDRNDFQQERRHDRSRRHRRD
jgi:hypothetical protein